MGDGTSPSDTPLNRKVNEVAEAMMEAWNRVDPDNPVRATEVANFADMARMLVDRYGLASDASETLYAIRRTDNELVYGEYAFLGVGGPGDWADIEDEHGLGDPAVTYELVKMAVEVVERRTFPTLAPVTEEEP